VAGDADLFSDIAAGWLLHSCWRSGRLRDALWRRRWLRCAAALQVVRDFATESKIDAGVCVNLTKIPRVELVSRQFVRSRDEGAKQKRCSTAKPDNKS
jgi:hypothetical protein